MDLLVRHPVRILLAFACLLWPPLAFAQAPATPAPEPAEYMIYQYPDMTLVVVVDVREAVFSTRITGPEGALVTEAGVPARRVGPVYQYIAPVDTPRQLMVEVRPEQPVDRARISMQLLQFPAPDPNAQLQARAYRALARGLQTTPHEASAVWAERVTSLMSAARIFASMGNEAMQLWSEYYAAHLILHGLGDVLLARERAALVRAAARRAGLGEIEMLATQIEAESLMREADRAQGEQARARLQQAHPQWEQVAGMAEVLGFEAERGVALYRDGMAYERQGLLDTAIERYEKALAVIGAGSDRELLNTVRATAASAYERSGSTSGALGLLEDITGDLAASGEAAMALELAHNLFEKGRLLNDTFRYAEAEPVLERALELRKTHAANPAWGATGLELGRARFALGEFEAAENTLTEALDRTPAALGHERYRALGTLASIAREQGRHAEASAYRERQQRLIEEAWRADFLFESALDARARDDHAAASRLMRQARSAGDRADWLTAHRAGLQLCLLARHNEPGGCDSRQAAAHRQALERSGVPSMEVEASLAGVRLLQQAGRSAEAREQAGRLLDTVQFYRERLPGVVAYWYAANRGDLYRVHLKLAREESALSTLHALERIRRLEAVVPRGAPPEDRIRAAIHRAGTATVSGNDPLFEQAHDALQVFRAQSGWRSGAMDTGAVRAQLEGLPRDSVVLAFDFSGDRVHAVAASREGAWLHELGLSADVRAGLDAALSALQSEDSPGVDILDRLGSELLRPLAGRLRGTILLIPSGPLNGFPLDVLRLRGEYLASRHRFISIDSLSSLGSLPGALSPDFGRQVFLAGNPRAGRELFSYGVSTSREIDAVRDRFVGDGLHIVQGVALRKDEFSDGRYANATLIHLTMPGRIDLAWPERSRFLLSGERESPAAEFLSPAELRSIPVQAELAVLGGTSWAGRDTEFFASRLGLVHDLHDAGTRQVVASLWPLEDERAAEFMSAFYTRLEQENDVAEALYQTRKSFMNTRYEPDLGRWAGFQLFIR